MFEIGPGPGGLTRALFLEGAEKVIAIEKDHRAIQFLEHIVTATDGHLALLEKDAMRQPIWKMGNAPRKIVANLPYNIAIALLLRWLAHANAFVSLTLMFQKEVAERICEPPGSKAYGILSVLTQSFYDTEYLFNVKSNVNRFVFDPPPKVASAVLRLRRKETIDLNCDERLYFRVVKTAFQQRRKTLRNSLKTFSLSTNLKEDTIFGQRPEQLGVSDFVRITNLIAHDAI